MEIKKMEELTNKIIEKVGKDKAGLIADDIGLLITDNSNMNTTISEKDKEIEKLKTDKENLITTNGNLLQQVAMGQDDGNPYDNKQKEEQKPKARVFDFHTVFDKKRKFYIKSIDKRT